MIMTNKPDLSIPIPIEFAIAIKVTLLRQYR